MPRSIEDLVAKRFRQSELMREQKTEAGQTCVNPVITISRSMGSGGRIVARKLAEDLGYSLWDKELIDAIARQAEMPPRVVEAFDERTISEISLLVHAAFGDYEMADFIYAKHLARTVAAIASVGNAIILGRGANFLLPNALHVRIDASMERRIQNMMTYEDIDEKAAAIKLKRSDRERRKYLLNTFGKDRVENCTYDLSLCMDRFSADDAAKIIETAHKVFFKIP